MGREIERKFLLKPGAWQPDGPGTPFRQGYLCASPRRSVRIRIAGTQAFLTIKGPTEGAARAEYEYPIPVADAEEMLATLSNGPVIEKMRYLVEHAGFWWEVDVFAGENAGLVLAEVELVSADQDVPLPGWVGQEVTHDARYYNANLRLFPYQSWGEAASE